MLRAFGLTAVLGVLACVTYAEAAAPRQYYSSWRRHTTHSYYYSTYYYKPTSTYVGYKHHYVVYHPQKKDHVYFYNPYKKVYWGRCPSQCGGKAQYSMLAEKDRKEKLEDIPEAAFPKPGKMPNIPDSDAKEEVSMDAPPDDLPPGDDLPKEDKKK